MDIYDTATRIEEMQRETAIRNARRPINDVIADKRRRLAEAHEIAAQRGLDDPDIVRLGILCQNGCGDAVTVENEDIFCSKECAEDWHRRDTRARKLSGR